MAKEIQGDLWAAREPYFVAAIESRCGSQLLFTVPEVAGIFDVGNQTVLRWIEEGRLVVSNFNQGADKRPFYKATRAALIEFAKRAEMGF